VTLTTSRRVHLRFAAATLAVIAAVGAALLWAARREEVRQAEQNVTEHAQYIERSILRDELRPRDLAAPASGARLRALDWLFDDRVLADGGLRVKIYRAPDGLVTYSNDHTLIGTRDADAAEVRTVVQGHVVRDVAYLNHEGGSGKNVKALEVYVPLTLRGERKARGMFELYASYAPVAAAVRSFETPFAVVLAVAVLALWATLFPLLERMVRALERSRAQQRTAEQALEETVDQLRQAQKLEAIGRLAGGVAHDFNNMLVAINGYAELLDATLVDEKQRRFATEIRAAGERAAQLTQQLLAFSRRQVLQPRVLDLNDEVRSVESMLSRVIGEGIRIVVDLEPGLRRVLADPTQISQVLLNLAVNARDAMDGSGTLTIRTRNDGSHVLLTVADTGAGMDDETRLRLFEPFFTTKAVGQGTGLGLATVYGIVTQSGGAIDVRSAPGRGAAFDIRLPATDAAPEAPTDGAATVRGGSERVLVVDDEAGVRDLVAHVLREFGYDVVVAASPFDALGHRGAFDLLLTDVVMPELTGPELAAELGASRVIYMSGYDPRSLDRPPTPFLQKPFDRAALVQLVREVLDAPVAIAA